MKITTRTRGFLPLLLVVGLAFAFGNAGAATITIVNNNAAGVGFNDPSPRAPVGGNPGTTLGDQRLYIFNTAASILGSILPSSVVIQVRASFAAQTCTATSATLGSTSSVSIHRDFAGALWTGTWYVQSLANRLAGVDLNATNPDISTTFNLSIDSGCFGPGLLWYYGVDGLEGTNIEMLPVAIHEICHGLNFATTTSGTSGNFNSGFPNVYDHYLMDNTNGLKWDVMTAAQRVASAISVNHLVWDGPSAKNMVPTTLGPRPQLVVNSPGAIAGNYDVQTATFGPAITLGGFTGDLAQVEDTVAPILDGCDLLTAATRTALVGKIALIDRGICTFVAKAESCQAAGAVGMVVVNNVASGLPGMGGTDPTMTIPCIGISQADGNAIKAQLAGGVNVTMKLNPAFVAGADNSGRPLMYAPNPFAGGSSVSHWDVSMVPNALMEPAINNDLHNSIDLALGLFKDIGWFPGTTATTLADFTALDRADGVLLKWRLSDASDAAQVVLQRASTVEGPWTPASVDLRTEGDFTLALDTSAEPGLRYFYRLSVTDRAGNAQVLGLVFGQRKGPAIERVYLGTPVPNPASRGSSVAFRITGPEYVRMGVVDVNGRKVRTLKEGIMLAGQYTQLWDGKNDRGTDVPSGVYFINLRTSKGLKTQRLAILR